MTKGEHEKLLAGENYDYRDPEIQALLSRCRQLVAQLNTTSEPAERTAIIHDLFGQIGDPGLSDVGCQLPLDGVSRGPGYSGLKAVSQRLKKVRVIGLFVCNDRVLDFVKGWWGVAWA